MTEHPKRVHEFFGRTGFETEDEAIAQGRVVALALGHSDFPTGSQVQVTDEHGDTIMLIPLVRLHS